MPVISGITYFFKHFSRLDHLLLTQDVCGNSHNILVRGDASSDASFFVAIGVMSWLYVIAAMVLYTVFSPMYSSNPLLPVIVSSDTE